MELGPMAALGYAQVDRNAAQVSYIGSAQNPGRQSGSGPRVIIAHFMKHCINR